jgi:hypothetical protein
VLSAASSILSLPTPHDKSSIWLSSSTAVAILAVILSAAIAPGIAAQARGHASVGAGPLPGTAMQLGQLLVLCALFTDDGFARGGRPFAGDRYAAGAIAGAVRTVHR